MAEGERSTGCLEMGLDQDGGCVVDAINLISILPAAGPQS